MHYNVMVEQLENGSFRASALDFPGCTVAGSTKAEVLDRVKQEIGNRLPHSERVSIEIPALNPWLQDAGCFANDPERNEIEEAVRKARKQANEAGL